MVPCTQAPRRAAWPSSRWRSSSRCPPSTCSPARLRCLPYWRVVLAGLRYERPRAWPKASGRLYRDGTGGRRARRPGVRLSLMERWTRSAVSAIRPGTQITLFGAALRASRQTKTGAQLGGYARVEGRHIPRYRHSAGRPNLHEYTPDPARAMSGHAAIRARMSPISWRTTGRISRRRTQCRPQCDPPTDPRHMSARCATG